MKYRTFRNLMILGGAAMLVGLWGIGIYLAGDQSSRSNAVVGTATSPPAGGGGGSAGGGVATVTNTQPRSLLGRASGTPTATSPSQYQSGQRREDQLILNFLATQRATTDKVKDAFPRESFKVNFYCEGGGANWTRLKIDLDRDGRDDEKWDLKDGQPAKRRVATRDDEQYDREYTWNNTQWVVKK